MTKTANVEPPTTTRHATIMPKVGPGLSIVRAPSRTGLLAAIDNPAHLWTDSDAGVVKTLPLDTCKPGDAQGQQQAIYLREIMRGLASMGYDVTARGNHVTAHRRGRSKT